MQVEIYEMDGKFCATIDGRGTGRFLSEEALFENLRSQVRELSSAIESAIGTFKR